MSMHSNQMQISQFNPIKYQYILGTRVDGTSYEDAVNRIITLRLHRVIIVVCVLLTST